MKKLVAIVIAAVGIFMLTPQSAEAQHFNRGFVGPGWGGSGFSISVGRGFGPAFGPSFAPGVGIQAWNRGFNPGFVNPGFYRPIPLNSFYRGGIQPGFNRGVGIQYGRGFRPGCGW